ncbi:hypothetical protein Hanom_Chr01g00041051 [Helianthus anomalus]
MQAKSSNFDSTHNICCTLDKTLSKMKPFKKILDFIDRCRLKKALIDRHKVYRSHIERFWTSARYKEEDTATHSFARVKEEGKDKDIKVIINPVDIRRVLDLKDNDNDPVGLSERLCKGLWFRMGFTANATGEKFLQYLRFIQMILDDKINNLEKLVSGELILDHMMNGTLYHLQVYKLKKPPPKRRKFTCIEKPDYVAPSDNKWHHDNSDSGNEDNKWRILYRRDGNCLLKMKKRKGKEK